MLESGAWSRWKSVRASGGQVENGNYGGCRIGNVADGGTERQEVCFISSSTPPLPLSPWDNITAHIGEQRESERRIYMECTQ